MSSHPRRNFFTHVPRLRRIPTVPMGSPPPMYLPRHTMSGQRLYAATMPPGTAPEHHLIDDQRCLVSGVAVLVLLGERGRGRVQRAPYRAQVGQHGTRCCGTGAAGGPACLRAQQVIRWRGVGLAGRHERAVVAISSSGQTCVSSLTRSVIREMASLLTGAP